MKKILILANNSIGLYNFRLELIEELIRQSYKVYFSVPENINDEKVKLILKTGAEFIHVPMNRRGINPIEDLKLMAFYKRILRKINPDIVLMYTIKPNIYGGIMCRLKKTPYIPNITGLGTAVENGGILQKITSFLYKIALKDAKSILFQNEENKDFMVNRKIVKCKYRVIPGSGVNLDRFAPLDYPDDEIINFLYISRIMKQKGIDEYLEAAKYIGNKYANTRFHILGLCEEQYEDILNELQKEDLIIYHGMQKDVRKFHEISHCTIHPTYYPEGMSNVLLESAASARPIITTDRSGCREIIDDGINGFIIKQQNSQDLINKVEEFLVLSYEEKKRMGIEGRKKVEKEFDRQIVVDAYMEEINRSC